MNPQTLAGLLAQQEGPHLEFKLQYVLEGQGKERNLDELAKDLVALVNTARGPAHLIIGAGDELHVDGSREARSVAGEGYAAQRLLDIVNARVTPPITTLAYQEVGHAGSIYSVISVEESGHVHYLARDLVTPHRNWPKNSVLVRHGSGVEVATPDEIREMERRRQGRRRSHAQLVDVCLDEAGSQYRQTLENGILTIRRTGSGAWQKFPTIDFKLRNAGDGTAVLHRLCLDILEASVDQTPVLSFSKKLDSGSLELVVNNHGWGDAKDCKILFNEPTLDRLYSTTAVDGTIPSGGTASCVLKVDKADRKALLTLPMQPLVLAPHDKDHYRDYSPTEQHDWMPEQSRSEPFKGVLLEDIAVQWQCNAGGQAFTGIDRIYPGKAAITRDGFVIAACKGPRPACGMASGATYVTGITLQPEPQTLEYPISRKIPPGDADRFHVLVGAPQSCRLKVRFRIKVDHAYEVCSDAFELHLWNPHNWALHECYNDGEELRNRRQGVQREIQEAEGCQREIQAVRGRLSNYYAERLSQLHEQMAALEKAMREYPLQ
ncbi:putative DNA binding domain-containing protein [Candidatus Woesearchaeota archaeon]|nr:putative DNA binding domain-containing protein [Candidatus Woesearchaeota archaeon]